MIKSIKWNIKQSLFNFNWRSYGVRSIKKIWSITFSVTDDIFHLKWRKTWKAHFSDNCKKIFMLSMTWYYQPIRHICISNKRVHHIIYLDMISIFANWIPKCLKANQKRAYVQYTFNLFYFQIKLLLNEILDTFLWSRENNNQWNRGINAREILLSKISWKSSSFDVME